MGVKNMINDISARLRALRKRRDWTQEDLAKHSGVSRAVIARIEAGITKQPELKHITKLAAALATTPEYLQYGASNVDKATMDAAKTIQGLPDGKKEMVLTMIKSLGDNVQ